MGPSGTAVPPPGSPGNPLGLRGFEPALDDVESVEDAMQRAAELELVGQQQTGSLVEQLLRVVELLLDREQRCRCRRVHESSSPKDGDAQADDVAVTHLLADVDQAAAVASYGEARPA